MQKTTLRKIWGRKDCFGWAWHCSDKNHRYMWQNDNDLGLFGEDLEFEVYVTKKVEVVKGHYLYLLSQRYSIESDGNDNTIPQIKAYLKKQHCLPLTKKEEMLIKRVNLI